MIWAMIIACVLTVAAGPYVIPYLRKLKMDQTEREEGVQSHLKKAGTPTMGGIMFLAAILVTSLIFVWGSPKILPVLIMTLGFGAIGFYDDYLKVVKKSSDGFKAWQKLALQIVITAIFAFFMTKVSGVSLELLLPFSGGKMWNIGWVAVPLLFFAVIGTVNGVNFTDGLDGLASSVTIVVAIFFAIVSYMRDGGVEAIALAVAGALMGFLMFNAYPAKIFMGDTGSLALGGFVAAEAYMLQMPIFLLIVGFIYLAEVVSVMLQVSYFKITHGKRIFKMTPIHHHFELCEWSETRIVAVFTVITAVLCALCFLGIK